jgi:FdhD protein
VQKWIEPMVTNLWRSACDPQRITTTRIIRWNGKQYVEVEDQLTIEEPLEIRLGGESLAVIMRTPGHDEELAAGFLFSEGLICQPQELRGVFAAVDADGLPLANVVEVVLAPEVAAVPGRMMSRHFSVSASCGLCGKTCLDALFREVSPLVDDDIKVAPETLYRLPHILREQQAIFHSTGSLHAAALFTRYGELRMLREDVGRHNAVDKLVGRAIFDGTLPLLDSILLVSGRVSLEIVQKAMLARVPIVAAISGPSDLAVDLARRGGLTLIGFLREQRMNVYAGAERISL